MRDRLLAASGPLPKIPVRVPVGQLIKSMLGSRTQDTVSLPAYKCLIAAYPDWPSLAAASAKAIQAVIADVTFPGRKAEQIALALRQIAGSHPDFALSFLARWPVERALAWLEDLPGVGRKVSASTLNFSTLAMPALVIDTHVLRILKRCGFVPAKANDALQAYEIVMPALEGWNAAELAELHVLLKHLGQTLCRHAHTDCLACSLNRLCRHSHQRRSAVSTHTVGIVPPSIVYSAP